ncbi:unnamed protein product [Mesocestoides corti]|uniref:Methyltransferase small domain-containing protein n=1 Tax=Mesocestoides corti TaxID=53468 RepID=A0A0R3U1F3_MESCO|nr:unnamed protein product [Mesocestoides corti]
MLPTPVTDSLKFPEFVDVYSPAEDSFLFLDALEKDIHFIRTFVNPALSIEACMASKSVFSENSSRYPLDSVCADLLSTVRQTPGGLADILLFNPPYVPTDSSELASAKSSLTAAWAGGNHGREVIDRFIRQFAPIIAKSGVLYLLLVRENKPDEVIKLISDSSNGRFSKAICVLQRRCRNEHLYVYRFFDPSFYPHYDKD